MNKFGILDENDFDEQDVISDQPIALDMVPSMEGPTADELEASILAQQPVPMKDRFNQGLSQADLANDEEYSQTSDRANKMELYGNLLDSYQNTIKNSISTVVPNFQKDGVADSLRTQGRNLLNEFYKKKQNKRQDQDQVGQNLAKEMGLESSEIDLLNKQQMNLPDTRLAELYSKLAKTNSQLKEEDISSLSAQQAADLAKQAMTAEQMANLVRFRESSMANRERSLDQGDRRIGLQGKKFDNQLTEQEQKQNEGIRNSFNKDSVVKKANEQIASADTITGLVNSDNPIGHAAVPTFMARAAGEVGALTEADKAPFGGTKALQGRISQVMEDYKTGKLTPENKKFILDLVGLVKKTANKNVEKVAERELPKISKANKIEKEEVKDLLLPPVKILDPNGNVRMIPASMVEKSIKAGGKRVD